jgi:hypothetical protein
MEKRVDFAMHKLTIKGKQNHIVLLFFTDISFLDQELMSCTK